MRKVTTILCSTMFLVCGILMAITSGKSPGTGYKSMSAATLYIPSQDTNTIELPTLPYSSSMSVEEKSLNDGADMTTARVASETIDSLQQRVEELERTRQVTKVKWCRAPAPEPIVVRDTIREAHYYLATQTGTKEGPGGECIPVYEVHKVDEICPEINNSSVKLSNELDNGVGE